VIVLLLLAGAVRAGEGPQDLPRVQLGAGIHLIQAQVAMTRPQLLLGLMFRETMPANEGMLLAFPQSGQHCLWMKNVLLPLSAAFVADDGRIVNIEDMAPGTLDRHCSAEPVRFALEMNQGWFAQRGIGPGFRLRGGPFQAMGQAP
jgi:uncharacterized membrane protein (UPF0127 family)